MLQLFKIALLASFLAGPAVAANPIDGQPWKSSALGVESGILWEVGTGTPFPYRMLQTQLSWRSAEAFGREFSDGSRLMVRHRFTLIGTAVQGGPEHHYFGASASPSVEWWNPAGTLSLFTGAGGGVGAIDSQGVKGGQGQDFTFNWFARGGLEHVVSPTLNLSVAIM